jgi:hypothetical protein
MSKQFVTDNVVVAVEPPSVRAIVMATGLALVVAAVLLVTAVLPAEYGIDPLGTGKALRLTDLSKTDAAKVSKTADPRRRPIRLRTQARKTKSPHRSCRCSNPPPTAAHRK